MKKFLIVMATVAMLAGATATSEATAQGRGGIGGLLVGCCFGIRTAGEWNEGKDLHWREWGRLIPYAGIVFFIWDGVEGAQGITTSDLAEQYGANFY